VRSARLAINPTLETDLADYFRTALKDEIIAKSSVEKGHGRSETRSYTASSNVEWIKSARSYPGQSRFASIKTMSKPKDGPNIQIAQPSISASSSARPLSTSTASQRCRWPSERREHALAAQRRTTSRAIALAKAPRTWPFVRRFALGLVRATKIKGSTKTRRKTAGWNPSVFLQTLQIT